MTRFYGRATLAFGLAMLGSGLGSSAWAAAGDVTVTIEPLPPVVSLSTAAQTTRAAYRVNVTNNTSNVLNKVTLRGYTTVAGADGATATFVEAIGGSPNPCAGDPADATAVVCSFGRLNGSSSPGSARSIVAIFNAPQSGSAIGFTAVATFKEGSSDQPNNPPGNDTTVASASTELSLDVPLDQAKSYIPSRGASLFTGPTGVATGADKWTTTIKVPSATTAAIFEDGNGGASCSAAVPVCFGSTVTVPGQFTGPFLEITVRRDASVIPTNAKIADVAVLYQGDGVALEDAVVLPACDQLSGGVPNEANKRCVKARKAYGKGGNVPLEFRGDWEFLIWGIENGRVSLR